MQSATYLKGLIQDRQRQALALLGDKGAQQWTISDQAKFDGLMDEIERTQAAMNASGTDEASLLQARSTFARAEQMAGFDVYIRKGNNLSGDERRLVKNTMSTGTAGQGGNTVAPLVAQRLTRLIAGYGFMRKVAARMETATGSPLGVSTSDGTAETGEQLAENAASSSLDPSFGTVAIPTYKFGSKIFTVPLELLQDSSIDVVEFVLQRAKSRIGRIQNQRFTTGTGTGQANGLTVAATVGRVGTTGQTTTAIYDDLVQLADSVDEAYLASPDTSDESADVLPGWMMSQSMRKVVRLIKDTSGRPIWTPGYTSSNETVLPTLLEYPVYINNDMPAPAANAKSLAFGNLRSYLIRDVPELLFYRFDDSAYVTKGQVGFLAFARAGGNLQDPNAVKTYQHSAT